MNEQRLGAKKFSRLSSKHHIRTHNLPLLVDGELNMLHIDGLEAYVAWLDLPGYTF